MLHRRASVWFEQNDLPAEAIRHALAASDFERAADLIEQVWLAMDLSYQSATLACLGKGTARRDQIRARPVLCVGYAWALLAVGEIEVSETHLRDAERWLEPGENPAEHSSTRMVVVDKAEFRVLPASIAAARAYRALALDDIPARKCMRVKRWRLSQMMKTSTARRRQHCWEWLNMPMVICLLPNSNSSSFRR